MAWPPPPLNASRSNLDPQWDTHPADHNAAGQAINDITTKIVERVAVADSYTPSGGTSVPHGTWTRLPCTSNEGPYYGEDLHIDFTNDAPYADEFPGLHLVVGMCQWAANASGRRILGVGNSSTASPHADNYRTQRPPSAGLFVQQFTVPFRITVVPTTFYLWCYQDSGGTLTTNTQSLAVVRLSPF